MSDGARTYFSTYPFSSAPTQCFTVGGSVCVTPDGSRGVLAAARNWVYTFTWDGSTYTNFTRVMAAASTNVKGASMTSDGSRVVIIADKVYVMGGWNGSTYTTWGATLDTSSDLSSGTWGVGVSPDGSKIVYQLGNKTVRYALWNGSNYSSGAQISNIPTAGNGFTPVFHPSGTMVYLPFGGFNLPYMYSVYNPNTQTFGAAVAIPTSAIPIGVSGFSFAVSSDGSFVLSGGYGRKIYKTAVTYSSQYV